MGKEKNWKEKTKKENGTNSKKSLSSKNSKKVLQKMQMVSDTFCTQSNETN